MLVSSTAGSCWVMMCCTWCVGRICTIVLYWIPLHHIFVSMTIVGTLVDSIFAWLLLFLRYFILLLTIVWASWLMTAFLSLSPFYFIHLFDTFWNCENSAKFKKNIYCRLNFYNLKLNQKYFFKLCSFS